MRKHVSGGSAGALLLASLAFCSLPARAQPNVAWPAVTVPPTVSTTATKDAALIIGIDEYAFVPHVGGAAANARDWFTFLVEGQKLPITRAHLLRDRDATREQILDVAKRAASEVEPGGRLWIVFIGHGAPAADGKDGVLVGVDAQQTAAGLYARSVPQRELLDAVGSGAQSQTILVLDACFSGRTSSGAPIAPGLQPIVRIADAAPLPKATTILSAGTSDQFAGPLPGTQRPAFSYLVLGALRGWADKTGSGEVTAEDAVSYAKLVLTVVPIGRSQTPQLQGSGAGLLLSQGAKEKGPSLASVSNPASEEQFVRVVVADAERLWFSIDAPAGRGGQQLNRCIRGQCTAETLVTTAVNENVEQLVLANGQVYWAERNRSTNRMSVWTAAPAPTMLGEIKGSEHALAVAGANVYVVGTPVTSAAAESAQVFKLMPGGVLFEVATGVHAACGLAADAENVYFCVSRPLRGKLTSILVGRQQPPE